MPLEVYGEAPLRELLNDLDWLERMARTHETVIERMLAGISDRRVIAAIRKRVAEGLTENAALEALRYLEGLEEAKAA